MKTDEFVYELPKRFIAQEPVTPRDSAKLMVVDRKDGSIKVKHFSDLPLYLNDGDCLVVNETRVRPARIRGVKKSTGAKIELLFLDKENKEWEALAKPAKRLQAGDKVEFENFTVTITGKTNEGHVKIVSDEKIEKLIETSGTLPLPPYIKNYTGPQERYQTVYSKTPNSVAAPTAGLHFTEGLLKRIVEKGIGIARVDLSVGWGTFSPVRENEIEEHKIHSERFMVSNEAAATINDTLSNGKKVFAIGTTSVRTIESTAKNGRVVPASGNTELFIYPGFDFQITSAMVTNFHLPKSTLLMLVSAFAGKDLILEAYRQAKKEDFRFFSFGDAMLVI